MKLPELKGFVRKVYPQETLGDKKTVKQTIVLELPARKYADQWGEEKEIRAEHFEMDVMNSKVPEATLQSLIDKKVIAIAYLNSYEYKEKDTTGAVTEVVRYGKSITLNSIKEFKG
jgi:hypothetical protein